MASDLLGGDYDYYELILDSQQAAVGLNGYTPRDWPLFKLGAPLQEVYQFKILEVGVPTSWYSIQSWNNTFILTISATNYTVTIPPGNYDSASIITALQAALTTAYGSTTWTVTYSAVTSKLTFTTASPTVTFSFTFGSSSDVGSTNPRNYLGFNAGVNGPYVTTGTAPNVVNLSGPNWVYIFSQKLGTLIDAYTSVGPLFDGNQSQALAKIPINVPLNNLQAWQDPVPDKWYNIEQLYNLGEIDFYFMSPELQLLQLNGLGFNIKVGVITRNSSKATERSSQFNTNRVVKRIRPI